MQLKFNLTIYFPKFIGLISLINNTLNFKNGDRKIRIYRIGEYGTSHG